MGRMDAKAMVQLINYIKYQANLPTVESIMYVFHFISRIFAQCIYPSCSVQTSKFQAIILLIWIRYVPGVRAERGVSVASGARNFSILIDYPWLGVSST